MQRVVNEHFDDFFQTINLIFLVFCKLYGLFRFIMYLTFVDSLKKIKSHHVVRHACYQQQIRVL